MIYDFLFNFKILFKSHTTVSEGKTKSTVYKTFRIHLTKCTLQLNYFFWCGYTVAQQDDLSRIIQANKNTIRDKISRV